MRLIALRVRVDGIIVVIVRMKQDIGLKDDATGLISMAPPQG